MKIEAIKREKITTDLEIVGATLLSLEEAKLVPQDLRCYSRWWWLRSSGYDSYEAAVVHGNGFVDDLGSGVFDGDGAVRPALMMRNFESSELKIRDIIFFGNKEFEIISDTLAFCVTDIAHRSFNSDCMKKDANIYETSDIKKLVDYWFEKSKEEA